MTAFSLHLFVQDTDLYLDRAFESVLVGAPPGLELLAVNAGSTDASELVLQEWAARDRRVRVVKTPRCTEADALGSVALRATGKLVGFMHARAVMRPGAWEQLEAAASSGPDVVVAGDGLPAGPVSLQQAIAARPRGWSAWVTPSLLRARGLSFSAPRLADDLAFSLSAMLAARSLVACPRLVDGVPAAGAPPVRPAETLAFFLERLREAPGLAGPLTQAALAELDAATPPAGRAGLRWELERLRAIARLRLLGRSRGLGRSWTGRVTRLLRPGKPPGGH